MYPTRKHKWVVKRQDSESCIAGMGPMLKSFRASSTKKNIQIPGKLIAQWMMKNVIILKIFCRNVTYAKCNLHFQTNRKHEKNIMKYLCINVKLLMRNIIFGAWFPNCCGSIWFDHSAYIKLELLRKINVRAAAWLKLYLHYMPAWEKLKGSWIEK